MKRESAYLTTRLRELEKKIILEACARMRMHDDNAPPQYRARPEAAEPTKAREAGDREAKLLTAKARILGKPTQREKKQRAQKVRRMPKARKRMKKRRQKAKRPTEAPSKKKYGRCRR